MGTGLMRFPVLLMINHRKVLLLQRLLITQVTSVSACRSQRYPAHGMHLSFIGSITSKISLLAIPASTTLTFPRSSESNGKR